MTDPVLARVHDAVLGGGAPPAPPRPVVSESWRRSLAVGVDPDADVAPVAYAQDDVEALRAEHPLARVLPVLRSTLVSSADEAMHLMIVTDADGCILWREGHTDVRLRADRAGLAEGTRWSEDAIGTNAMGTTLALDRPVSIHSAEHLVRAYHGWTCAAAPVHDPDTGALLGAIDVTGPTATRHPSTLALVTEAAQLAENALRLRMTARDAELRDRYLPRLLGGGALLSPSGRVLAAVGMALPSRLDLLSIPDGLLEPLDDAYLLRPGGAGSVVLDFLGATRPVVVVDGRAHPLSPRHADILAVLALHPGGRTAEELALAVVGEKSEAKRS
ncbi:GAF domain-containing protein [Actinokineospora soli]